ncbi:hypothetical protein [Achromobacter xylosoxidans]|uniref:hypothetical protein n=1 Tax=Alcaligenes xylosoxydans xylosoxydans TaxID=85698 RepID=UPI0022B8BE78|nr:hypothetical protein [Achromobacter xylosoxidans]MCZ8391587.1 hypothetical protein [Achromobacter xylosoxidans]
MSEIVSNLSIEFARLIERARNLSADMGTEIEELMGGSDAPSMTPADARELLDRVITAIRHRQAASGQSPIDMDAAEKLIEEVMITRGGLVNEKPAIRLELLELNGIRPRPVQPTTVFHTREVPLNEGYVRTRDINLWDSNERIEIHLQQFQRKHGRKPNPQELLDIMFSHLRLEGVTEEDQFKIPALARSIAANGIRKPPIISLDGRLLDGNRRLAACYYILNNEEFDLAQKKRVEYILVWQLTEHATPNDEEAIIVSLNFEDDHKQPWPEYVKARKVYEEWKGAITLEPTSNVRRQAEMKREISKRFALGFDTSTVSRYIKMVEAAEEFEDHHIIDRQRDQYAVKHKAAEYFQYFDELTKGTTPGGVSYELNRQPELKNVVFELLYGDKFKNWKQIRDLRWVVDNSDARDLLLKAAATECKTRDELEDSQDNVEAALALGRVRRAEERLLGSNQRIESFVTWLLNLPLSAFGDPNQVRPDNLDRLHAALQLVEGVVVQQRTTTGRAAGQNGV